MYCYLEILLGEAIRFGKTIYGETRGRGSLCRRHSNTVRSVIILLRSRLYVRSSELGADSVLLWFESAAWRVLMWGLSSHNPLFFCALFLGFFLSFSHLFFFFSFILLFILSVFLLFFFVLLSFLCSFFYSFVFLLPSLFFLISFVSLCISFSFFIYLGFSLIPQRNTFIPALRMCSSRFTFAHCTFHFLLLIAVPCPVIVIIFFRISLRHPAGSTFLLLPFDPF